MNTIGERVKFVLKEKGIKRKDLADKIGITAMAVGNLIKNEVKKPRILDIAMALGVNPQWLQDGTGEMDLDHSDLLNGNEVSCIEKDQNYSVTHIEIDLYDVKLSAGTGKGCTVEWIPRKSDEPLLFRQAWFKQRNLNPKSCKAMYVRGHSMYPVLKDWDTVIVNIHDTEIIDGEIYALTYKNNFYIKQVVRNGDRIELISFHPDYKPIEVNEEQLSELKIIGRQVWRGG